ncbi:MAG: FHA domain-containing protein [Planctomycetaceae bacterium]|nr:FHA domain-containing protein [Planctomycetaceae bacterium]
MKFNVSIFAGGVLKGNKQITTPCVIGRSKEADLTITHPVMSRKHCELFEEAGNLYLRDNSSLNGTIYKGTYIENPTPLQLGDEFTVGELTFKISPLTAPLSEEQRALADRPTVAISLDSIDSINNNEAEPEAKETSDMVTILEENPKKTAPTPANESTNESVNDSTNGSANDSTNESAAPKKNPKKISPKDVRIVT